MKQKAAEVSNTVIKMSFSNSGLTTEVRVYYAKCNFCDFNAAEELTSFCALM